MKRFWIFKGIKCVVLAILLVLVAGAIVMKAWNFAIPHIFDSMSGIGYWQAVALVVLTRVLFWRGWGGGGCGHHHGGGPMHWQNNPYFKKMMEKRFEKMTPEQQEKIKQYWEYRCGGWKGSEEKPFPGEEKENKEQG